MNIKETADLLAFLAENFKGFNPTKQTAAAWAIVLATRSASEIMEAARIYCTRLNRFAPTPADLIHISNRREERINGHDAWEMVRSAVQLNGYMSPPNFKDEKIVRCIRFLGGWASVCAMNPRDAASNRVRFIEHYDHLSEREYAADSRFESEQALRIADPEAMKMFNFTKRTDLFLPSDLEGEKP